MTPREQDGDLIDTLARRNAELEREVSTLRQRLAALGCDPKKQYGLPGRYDCGFAGRNATPPAEADPR